jgi:hypothetical protein
LYARQIKASVRLGLKFLVLALSPGLDGLVAQELQALGDEFFGLIGFDDIACGVFNNLQESFKLGEKLRVALQAVKKVLGA